MTEHVILVAFTVEAQHRADAHDSLIRALALDGLRPHGVCGWWVAEDDRRDGSDGDSAAFIARTF